MFKPQQGAFIGYDEHPLINTGFFEDFIYINFDNIEGVGHPDIDWVTYPDLKEIFKRWEWFETEDEQELKVDVKEAKDTALLHINRRYLNPFSSPYNCTNVLAKRQRSLCL